MIYEVRDGAAYVISSGGMWLPGAYATKQAARWAYQFPDETLLALRDRINREERRDITTDDLRKAKSTQPTDPPASDPHTADGAAGAGTHGVSGAAGTHGSPE